MTIKFADAEAESGKAGLHIPNILLPSENIDLGKWAVIACDQFTSEPEYWNKVEEYASDAPSALDLMLPEAYLKTSDQNEYLSIINLHMKAFIESGILRPLPQGFILVDRRTPFVLSRKGLLAALDLDVYDFRPSSKSLARATEGTVLDRIPPRVKIRQNALLEMPHIMLLIDDPVNTVIEPAFESAKLQKPVYDFDLMMSSGHLNGYLVSNPETLFKIAGALNALKDNSCSGSSSNPFLYAVGDGNHSLAAAKTHWENIKASIPIEEWAAHPARFALVEIVNIHDEGLLFHPIHRIVFGVENSDFFNKMRSFYEKCGAAVRVVPSTSAGCGENISDSNDSHRIRYISNESYGDLIIEGTGQSLAYGALQMFIDQSDAEFDYIHGDESLKILSRIPGNIGFFMPSLDKNTFFNMIAKEGVLPRKTFSMGEAAEKRFYLECRRIVYDKQRRSSCRNRT